jgi:hypothetical protein
MDKHDYSINITLPLLENSLNLPIMFRLSFFIIICLFCFQSKAQSTNAGDIDSTFILFPNPAHGNFFVTTQGRIFYAMIITSHGEKKMEYWYNDIVSYPNQYGIGCSYAGCVGGTNVASNYIFAMQRNNLENGIYYLVLLDELGHAYYKQFVLE